ncbi:MAG: PKD domain-containing protein [Ferruginibacter sp.]
MKKCLIALLIVTFISSVSYCQITKRALFLGNSYTDVNNLPQIIVGIAHSMGDDLYFEKNVPGGFRFEDHYDNTTSINKIKAGGWDFVVLQEQSQLPSYPENSVQVWVYPYAHLLDSLINAYNNCGETMFYMTWGRKNGDASNCGWWPPVCTYEGMDSLLYERYMKMTNDNNAVVSPVGQVWKYIRQHYPTIELYHPDQSHPSLSGSYAAACCFYTCMFKKDPLAITFDNGLPPTDAANIRIAVKNIVYDSLMKWQVGKYDPVAAFNFVTGTGNEISFINSSVNASNYAWDFGDNNTSADINPVHTYTADGIYTVKLTASNYCYRHSTNSNWYLSKSCYGVFVCSDRKYKGSKYFNVQQHWTKAFI